MGASVRKAVDETPNRTRAFPAVVTCVRGRVHRFLVDRFLSRFRGTQAAVVAHELGHVWIFTHHPYLQTEESANRIALELVSRDTLDRAYGKVWTHVGSKGRLTYFHGE